MTKAELMKYVGKKVTIYFEGKEVGIYGILGYLTDEMPLIYGLPIEHYFYINNTMFKACYVKKLVEKEVEENG